MRAAALYTVWGLFACSQATDATPTNGGADLPKAISDVSLKDCTPKHVAELTYLQSNDRDGDNARQRLRVLEKFQHLTDSLPKVNQPVSQLMNPAQSAEFAELSGQLLIQNYNHLAESKLQRDATAIDFAIDALEALRTGKGELKTKYDKDGEGAGLIGLLRKAVENDTDYGSEPSDTKTCSLDLAMYRAEQVRVAEVKKLIAEPEMTQWIALRDKYRVTGPLDPNKLPSPDKEKAIWLAKAIAEPASREMQAASDWESLRLYVKVSRLEYTTFRDDIIAGAGAKDYDYDTSIKKAYAGANSATKHIIDAWGVIDHEVPSDAQKEFKSLAEMNKAAAAK